MLLAGELQRLAKQDGDSFRGQLLQTLFCAYFVSFFASSSSSCTCSSLQSILSTILVFDSSLQDLLSLDELHCFVCVFGSMKFVPPPNEQPNWTGRGAPVGRQRLDSLSHFHPHHRIQPANVIPSPSSSSSSPCNHTSGFKIRLFMCISVAAVACQQFCLGSRRRRSVCCVHTSWFNSLFPLLLWT